MLDDKVTTVPPVGAWPLNWTVPVELAPPTTDAGFMVTEYSAAGLRVSDAVFDAPLKVAVMTADSVAVTPVVVTVNVAVELPEATVTDAGTFASAELLERLTTAPLAPAGWPRVTVPVEFAPPKTVVGLSETVTFGFAVTARVAVAESVLAKAVSVDDVSAVTVFEVTENVPVVWPAATVAVAGTVAADVFELVRVTTVPEGPAGPPRVIVPVTGVAEPPTTVVGETARAVTPAAVTARVPCRLTVPSVPVTVTLALASTATVVAVKVA